MKATSAILFLLICSAINRAKCDTIEPGWCSIYGECGYNPTIENAEFRGSVPCKNNSISMEHYKGSEFFELYSRTCPDLAPPDSESAFACCSWSQLNTLAEQLVASALLFARCPSCVANLYNLICQNTCSPNQSMFVNVTRSMENNQPTPIALEYTAHLSKDFADRVFNSCKDVVFPQTNGKAVDLMCNGYSGPECTTQRWLDYMGSTNNGIAPMDIIFKLYDNTTTPPTPPSPFEAHEAKTYGCTEAPPDEEPCSCTDCPATCPVAPPIQTTPAPFLIGDMDGVLFIVIIVFSILALAFFAFICTCYFRKRNKPQQIDFKQAEIDDLYSKINEEIDGHATVLPGQIGLFEKWGKRSQDVIMEGFQFWGHFIAKHPISTIVIALLTVLLLSVGISMLILTTDPIQLWSSEGSKIRGEKDFFDENFGAFYRTEQIILKLQPELEKDTQSYTSYTSRSYNFSAILAKERMLELLKLQNEIRYLKAPFPEAEVDLGRDYITLKDICFKPLEPDNNNCTIMSILNYWQNDPNEMDKIAYFYDELRDINYTIDFHDHFLYCVQAPNSIQDTTELKQNCMGDFGGPILPYVAMGGYENDDYHSSIALIFSFMVNNYPRDTIRFKMALAWEKEFLKIIQTWNNTNFTTAYFSERSIEDELVRSSQADLIIFAGSYVAIFLYITIGLGTYSSLARIPVDSKMTLGFAGILVILSSVFASVGFYGYIGIATSLIVIEVVPFLVLAIGADNVFILTLEFQRDERKPGETLESQVGRVLGEVGPSMLLCSLTESVAFFLGALSDMPAVQQFALCAALAILIDFVLQVTVFVAVLTLDAKRQESNRADVLCCVKLKGESTSPQRLEHVFEKYYTPTLMLDIVRVLVMLAFFLLFFWCIFVTSNITVGLDQDLSVPLDSYILNYFDYMEKYLSVGVPVYFVTRGPFNFSNPDSGHYVCSTAGCYPYSAVQQISFAAQNPEYWKIETPSNSWYDDYSDWVSGFGQKSCCRYESDDPTNFCPATEKVIDCEACLRRNTEPTSDEFMNYLPWFLKDNPGVECNKGGHAAYGNAVSLGENEDGASVVAGSYFFTYHSICIKSTECTDNLKRARELADNITKTLYYAEDVPEGFEVYPYAIYYVYYEQYLTMVEDTIFQLGMCLIPTFIFNFVLLGFDFYSGLITTVTILMIVVDTAGICSLWGVDLNAVSLINLVAAIGLSIEFTSHVVRAFSLSTKKGRKRRVIDAMKTMGPAVFAGVALTNLPGIAVLAFAKAQLIQIFFFRMCLIITLLGMAHGLIFLPVFLSYFGPPVNKAILYDKQQKIKSKVDIPQKFINPGFEEDEKIPPTKVVDGPNISPMREETITSL
ncbi:NPC1-like intracellular cholesterol transporter 1 [Styela clava]